MSPYVAVCHTKDCFARETIWDAGELLPPAPKTELSRCPACEKPVTWKRIENALPFDEEDLQDGENETWIQQELPFTC